MCKELICITCPQGCHLTVHPDHDYAVSGNSCPRGAEYGKSELLHPVRVLTSTVRLEGGPGPRLNVKSSRPIPKELLFRAMEEVNRVVAVCPVRAGDVLMENLCGTGISLVAAKTVL